MEVPKNGEESCVGVRIYDPKIVGSILGAPGFCKLLLGALLLPSVGNPMQDAT